MVQHVGVSANTPEFLPRDAVQDHRVSRELRRSLRFIDLRCRGRRVYGEDSCRFPKGAAEWVASLGAEVIAAPTYTAERKVRQLFEVFSKKKCPPTSSLVGASRCGGDRASVADFAARWCDAAGERLRRVTQLATHGGHTQAMLVLLRLCVGGPTATFVLRACGAWAGDALSQHDAACRSAFEIAVCSLEVNRFLQ